VRCQALSETTYVHSLVSSCRHDDEDDDGDDDDDDDHDGDYWHFRNPRPDSGTTPKTPLMQSSPWSSEAGPLANKTRKRRHGKKCDGHGGANACEFSATTAMRIKCKRGTTICIKLQAGTSGD
jgi:hypothetical protein